MQMPIAPPHVFSWRTSFLVFRGGGRLAGICAALPPVAGLDRVSVGRPPAPHMVKPRVACRGKTVVKPRWHESIDNFSDNLTRLR